MRHSALLLLLPLILPACRDGEDAAPTRESHPFSAQCAACHAKETRAWQESHHAHSWRKPDASLDGEAFNLSGTPGANNHLHSKDGKNRLIFSGISEQQLCIYDSANANPADASANKPYKVVAAIGHTPLVQYLVEGERGAFQCTAAAWDVNRREWFDTVADDARLQQEGTTQRERGDWGHWLGRGMTWNSQCASCHVSGFEKNYDAATDSYASRWQEPEVTCIQCHSLADTPTEPDGRPVRRNKGKVVTPRQQADTCATCHARREELRPGFREGDLFEDFYRLELPLAEGIFWPNGAQRDECYTETGMRLSAMGKAGVNCMNCHDAHSGRLLASVDDNTLCLRCHGRPGQQVNGTPVPQIHIARHTPCPTDSKGGSCVECHMPQSTYMARDARRDHAFTSPDPQLGAELGIPNACTQCHADKEDSWAAEAVVRFYGATPRMAKYRPRTRAVAAAMRGEGNAAELLAAYRAEENPTWQAALLELLARQEPAADSASAASAASATIPATIPAAASAVAEAVRAEALKAAASQSPLLRAAAARILGAEAPQLLNDPVRLVRYAAAWAQLDFLLASPTPPRALRELEETLSHQADHPAGAMQLAALAQARARQAASRNDAELAARHRDEAERQFRRALSFDPASAIARMDFAVFLARHSRPVEALEQMLLCTAAHPTNAEAQYRLALILHELGHSSPALLALKKALDLSPNHPRALRAYAELQLSSPTP